MPFPATWHIWRLVSRGNKKTTHFFLEILDKPLDLETVYGWILWQIFFWIVIYLNKPKNIFFGLQKFLWFFFQKVPPAIFEKKILKIFNFQSYLISSIFYIFLWDRNMIESYVWTLVRKKFFCPKFLHVQKFLHENFKK